jgi:hypothetical protein
MGAGAGAGACDGVAVGVGAGVDREAAGVAASVAEDWDPVGVFPLVVLQPVTPTIRMAAKASNAGRPLIGLFAFFRNPICPPT